MIKYWYEAWCTPYEALVYTYHNLRHLASGEISIPAIAPQQGASVEEEASEDAEMEEDEEEEEYEEDNE